MAVIADKLAHFSSAWKKREVSLTGYNWCHCSCNSLQLLVKQHVKRALISVYHSVFMALLWCASSQTAKIHELIKPLFPLGLWLSQKWKPNKFSVPFFPLISVFICFGNNKTHYTDHCCCFTSTCTHTVTFTMAVSGASIHWQGKSSERPLPNTWMYSHNCWWNPVICFPEIKSISLIDFNG